MSLQTSRSMIRPCLIRVPSVALFAMLASGCHSNKLPVYENAAGFRFTPPAGWVERARDDALPAKSATRRQELPLPPLDTQIQERLLVRYDRLAPGSLGWLRITAADGISSTAPLKTCLVNRLPDKRWKPESEEEELEVGGLPAVRVAHVGSLDDQEYLCETVVVRSGTSIYFITASFPASDGAARDEVRAAITAARWR